MKFDEYVVNNNLGVCKVSKFSDLTTISCGGDIKCLFYPKDIDSLKKAFKYICKNNLKYFILGNGSNVLASDDDYNGIVICLKKLNYYIDKKDDIYNISAFYPSIKLAYDLADRRLGDLSFLGSIPGLIGGAIYNNSGAFNDCIGNHIIKVKYINTNGDIVELLNDCCAFSYRKSIFHFIEGIIIECSVKLIDIETEAILKDRKQQRLLSQPVNVKSMGSIFKNNPLLPSWKVIDALGLRGFRIGDGAVSSKHANFIINLGNAKSRDILSLIELIETRAFLEFGIKMVREIVTV